MQLLVVVSPFLLLPTINLSPPPAVIDHRSSTTFRGQWRQLCYVVVVPLSLSFSNFICVTRVTVRNRFVVVFTALCVTPFFHNNDAALQSLKCFECLSRALHSPNLSPSKSSVRVYPRWPNLQNLQVSSHTCQFSSPRQEFKNIRISR